MSKQNCKPLRFAALIRVSSERQKKRGKSLETQEGQIKSAVATMGGVITARYAGQEHATAGWEREQLNQLLADATKRARPFDAVIVADPSRWSRDNESSKAHLKTLREHGVRFFVLMDEYDLYDPNRTVLLGLQTEMNGYQAELLAQKSILNRIAKAKQGELGVGALPWGRTYDKHATRPEDRWGIDPVKKAAIEDIARRYIAGEPLAALAAEYRMDRAGLCKTLATRCGTDWTMTFESKRFNIHEKVTIQIPPLLDAKTIKAVANVAQANCTYKHGHLKYRYLFSRMVFCGHCGSALSGTCIAGKQRYYYHLDNRCLGGGVRADQLEAKVMRQLFETFGNAAAVERAIREATPDLGQVEEEQKRLDRLVGELDKVKRGRDRIISFIANGSITDDHARTQLEELTKREAKLVDDAERLRQHLDSLPDAATVKATAARLVSARLVAKCRRANAAFDDMTWDEQRALAQIVFGGALPDGRRMGVYVSRIENERPGRQFRRWAYTIHGHLIDEAGNTGKPPFEQFMAGAVSGRLKETSARRFKGDQLD